MATQKLTVPSHSTVLNTVDRMIHNPVRNPEIPQLNASFATEAILLTINTAPFIVILLTNETNINLQELPIYPNKTQVIYANI
jgi:hypothetical protein